MSGNKCWKKELRSLNIPFYIHDNLIYIWNRPNIPYTVATIWKLINAMRSGYPYKKYLKHYHHRKNRRETQRLLTHAKHDNIPQNKPTKVEDPWKWD